MPITRFTCRRAPAARIQRFAATCWTHLRRGLTTGSTATLACNYRHTRIFRRNRLLAGLLGRYAFAFRSAHDFSNLDLKSTNRERAFVLEPTCAMSLKDTK